LSSSDNWTKRNDRNIRLWIIHWLYLPHIAAWRTSIGCDYVSLSHVLGDTNLEHFLTNSSYWFLWHCFVLPFLFSCFRIVHNDPDVQFCFQRSIYYLLNFPHF
jgi:hypothetical protein